MSLDIQVKKIHLGQGGGGSKNQIHMAGLIRPPIKGSAYIRPTPPKRGLTAFLIQEAIGS